MARRRIETEAPTLRLDKVAPIIAAAASRRSEDSVSIITTTIITTQTPVSSAHRRTLHIGSPEVPWNQALGLEVRSRYSAKSARY
jgi:hypothetical protein